MGRLVRDNRKATVDRRPHRVPLLSPCHKAQIISDWFLEHDNEITLIKWPPQSPDLNPIEHLWDVVERRFTSWISIKITNGKDHKCIWCFHFVYSFYISFGPEVQNLERW